MRLECAVHPWDGKSTTAELEQAGARRLVDSRGRRRRGAIIASLPERARMHVREALLAYVEARGDAPSVLPGDLSASEEDAAQ